MLAMLLLVTMVRTRWCCPRHVVRECCAVLAMLLLLLVTAPRFELPGHFGYKQDTRLQAGTFHPWVSGVGFAP